MYAVRSHLGFSQSQSHVRHFKQGFVAIGGYVVSFLCLNRKMLRCSHLACALPRELTLKLGLRLELWGEGRGLTEQGEECGVEEDVTEVLPVSLCREEASSPSQPVQGRSAVWGGV